MQDKAIAAIGEWQLAKNKDLEPVDLYIENMFPGKDYQMLLLIFEIFNNNGELNCEYKGIDIEKVSAEKEDYRKYAFRNGTSARAGDVTISTRITVKKLKNIKDLQFKKISTLKGFDKEVTIFKLIEEQFNNNYNTIENQVKEYIDNSKKNKISNGASLKIIIDKEEKYLYDFDVIKHIIVNQFYESKTVNNKIISKSKNKKCSTSGNVSDEIYGFAAPFAFSSPDKNGFISGFFNKKKNWKNYPISKEEALKLELGSRYIIENLKARFYGHDYLIIPSPILKTETKTLKKIISLLQNALVEQDKISKERKKRTEEYILKKIANEENYFNIDLLFFKTSQSAMKIQLHIEEQLPSRFRKIFINVPKKINKNKLFKNAITIKKELQDLNFSFQVVKNFFDKNFLDIVQKIFLGNSISTDFLFENIIGIIRKNYNASKTSDGWVEPINWTIKKAIMLINYLQELNIITYNKNYKYMEVENTQKKESSFNLEGFNSFVKENSNFLDSDIKVGIFSVGILTRFLFDIQSANLNNTPFENKLRGYKLNPELLMQVYTEALDKIQKYQKNFYVYTDLRDIVNKYFVLKSQELTKMTNNELSFYFVAGLEMGKQFKNKKENNQ